MILTVIYLCLVTNVGTELDGVGITLDDDTTHYIPSHFAILLSDLPDIGGGWICDNLLDNAELRETVSYSSRAFHVQRFMLRDIRFDSEVDFGLDDNRQLSDRRMVNSPFLLCNVLHPILNVISCMSIGDHRCFPHQDISTTILHFPSLLIVRVSLRDASVGLRLLPADGCVFVQSGIPDFVANAAQAPAITKWSLETGHGVSE